MAANQANSYWLKKWCFILALSASLSSIGVPAKAVVKFSDGFGDGDRTNNGTALEISDVDVGNGTIGPYIPARGSNGTLATNPEITTVLDANDVGLRWLSHSGFTGANNGDRRAFLAIVDDTQGSMLETQPTSNPGGLGLTAINDGYALSYNSKGRGNSAAALFDETIALGDAVGDQVKVSFDLRVWRDAPNANAVEQPDDAEIRFGLFQDTDSQLGDTNPVAGRDTMAPDPVTQTPAVWGQEDGYFDGTRGALPVTGSNIGSENDRGWFGAVVLENPVGSFPPIGTRVNGGAWRIREETNMAGADPNDRRIMQGNGDLDPVAQPVEATPGMNDYGLINLDVRKVYNLSLTLERATDVTPGDTILASLTATDRATGISYTLSDFEPIINADVPDGISSDSWDYFAIRNTGLDDMDLLIDNFKLELFGSNAGIAGDFDGDGDVDGRDFLRWQRGGSPNSLSAGDLALWQAAYGNGPLAATAAVPEPTSVCIAAIGLATLIVRRKRI